MTSLSMSARHELVQAVARRVGRRALEMFQQRERLVIESKGLQDMVSAADREIEQLIRAQV
ncbi:MAG TPA: hypothetical protein VFL64_17545, partial [Rhizobacter sp.]|nr:hypothetical protein [Rhizobacter sp.]